MSKSIPKRFLLILKTKSRHLGNTRVGDQGCVRQCFCCSQNIGWVTLKNVYFIINNNVYNIKVSQKYVIRFWKQVTGVHCTASAHVSHVNLKIGGQGEVIRTSWRNSTLGWRNSNLTCKYIVLSYYLAIFIIEYRRYSKYSNTKIN